MVQLDAVQQKLATENKRHENALRKLAAEVGLVIHSVERDGDELFIDTFIAMVEMMILDRYEQLLVKAKRQLEAGKSFDFSESFTLINRKQLDKIIKAHGALVASSSDIVERHLGFDEWFAAKLQEEVEAGAIPPVVTTWHDEKGIRVVIHGLASTATA